MRRRFVTLGLVVGALVVVIAAGLFVADYLADPPTASCAAPPTTFGPPTPVPGHIEVDVHYTCEGAAQAATLYLPTTPGPHAAVVWIHGAGPDKRLRFGDVFAPYVDAGIGILSYDKRGVGDSQGSCCPGDNGHFNLLSADIQGAVAALASRDDIKKDQIGLIGASQAGWIAPKAAAMSGKVAFIGLASSTPLTERLTNLYERLARGDEGQLSREEISRRLASNGPSGFDPLPYWRQLSVPSLWMFGTADDRVPVPESVAILDQLRIDGKDVTVVTFQNAGHGLLDSPPTAAEAPPTLASWVVKRLR